MLCSTQFHYKCTDGACFQKVNITAWLRLHFSYPFPAFSDAQTRVRVHFQSIDSCHTVKDKQYFKSTTQLACMNIGGWVRKNPDCTVLWHYSSSLYGSNIVPHNRPSTHFVHMAVSFCVPSEQFCQHNDILKNLSRCFLTQPRINYNTKQTSLCCTK